MSISEKTVHTQLKPASVKPFIPEDDVDQVDIRRALMAMWKQKGLILLCMLVAAVLVFAGVSRLTPLYTAKASVMLDPRAVQVLASDDLMADLNLNNPMLDTEAVVLRSNILLESVVAELGYESLAPIDPALVERPLAARVSGALKSFLGRLLGAEPVVRKLTPEDIEAQKVRRLVAALRSRIAVWREGQSYLISVSAQTPDPVLSRRIANSIVEVYIQRQIDRRNAVVREATSFLSEQVEEMRIAVEEAEARVEDYRSRQVEEVGASSDTVDRQILELSTQLAMAQADLAQSEARQDRIESVIETTGIEQGAELLSSPFILSLRQQIAEVDRREADLATRFSPEYPERATARSEQEQLRAQLAKEVETARANIANDVEVASARVASIRQSVSEMEARASAISRANVDLRQLEREADALRNNFQSMLTRLSETRSTEQLQRADARQVERAVTPSAPSSPRVMLFTVLGATIGFAFGLLLTFYRHATRSGYVHAQEIERDLRVLVVASLLKGKFGSRRTMLKLLFDAPFGLIADRLRQLRTAMSMASHTHGGICVAVTSALAGESKTSTAVGLAALDAMAKRRCVIVDLDLRRSTLNRELGYNAVCDLADVLQRGAPLKDAIYRVEGTGFDVITTHKRVPGLIDELDMSALADLITKLKREYDLVLLDTPPLLLVSDGIRLSALADMVLLLIRQRKTHRTAVQQAYRRLRSVTAQPIAVAMTMTDVGTEKEAYGYYGTYEVRDS